MSPPNTRFQRLLLVIRLILIISLVGCLITVLILSITPSRQEVHRTWSEQELRELIRQEIAHDRDHRTDSRVFDSGSQLKNNQLAQS